MKTILVTGVGGPAGRNVSELLAERGYRVVGVDMRPISFTGQAFYLVPPAAGPDYLDVLSGIVDRENVDLVIPTVSEELTIVAEGWNGKRAVPAVIAPAQAVALANDKYLTSRALAARGVPVPRFALPSQLHSIDELGEKIGWPCISKPRVGRGGRQVKVCTADEWTFIHNLTDDTLLQEFAPGTDYAPNVFVDFRSGQASRSGCVSVLEKTELKEGIIGNALSVRKVSAPDVAQVALQAAQAAGLHGPLDIDIRRRLDGQPVVLEINARFGANIRSAPEVLQATLLAYQVSP